MPGVEQDAARVLATADQALPEQQAQPEVAQHERELERGGRGAGQGGVDALLVLRMVHEGERDAERLVGRERVRVLPVREGPGRGLLEVRGLPGRGVWPRFTRVYRSEGACPPERLSCSCARVRGAVGESPTGVAPGYI